MAAPKNAKPEAPSAGAVMLAEVRAQRDAHRVFSWPGTDLQVQLVPLSDGEMLLAEAAAFKHFADIGLVVDHFTLDDLKAEIGRQILALSLRVYDPDQPELRSERLYRSASEFRRTVEYWEREALSREYLALQNEIDRTSPGALPDELLTEMAELIKKKDATALSKFDSCTLARYAITTATQPDS